MEHITTHQKPASVSQLATQIGAQSASNRHKVLSLFAGCGGLDLGFMGGFKFGNKPYARLPFQIIWANEIEPAACRVYESNLKHNIVEGDINALLDSDAVPRSADIVLGGFPCQDFSIAGKRRGFQSERGGLYRSMVEVVARSKPKVFIAENVRGLLSIEGAIERIKSDFAELGYSVNHHEVLACDYGVPQTRQRVFIIGWRSKARAQAFTMPPIVKKQITAKEAIGDLEGVGWNKVDSHIWSRAKRTNGQGQRPINANGPAPTMRAEHHGNIEFHYNNKRRLSVREAARFQSFHDKFLFGEATQTAAYRMIGNAVPPVLGWHIANAIKKTLDDTRTKRRF